MTLEFRVRMGTRERKARVPGAGSFRRGLCALSGPLSKADGGLGLGCQGQAARPGCRGWRDTRARPHGLPGPALTYRARVHLLVRSRSRRLRGASLHPRHLGPGPLKQAGGTRPQNGWGGRKEDPEGLGGLHRRRLCLSLCAAPPPSLVGVAGPQSGGDAVGGPPTPTGVRMPLLFWKTRWPGFLRKAHRSGLPRCRVLDCAPSFPCGSPKPAPPEGTVCW